MDSDLQPNVRSYAWLRRSLARDTAVLVLGLSLLAAILMGIAARKVLDSALRTSLEGELNREFERAQAALDAWRASQRDDLEALARDPGLIAALARGGAGRAAALARLEALAASEPEALGLAVLRGRGTNDVLAVSNWLPSDWAQSLERRAASQEIGAYARIEGTAVEFVRVPVKGSGEPALLVAAVDPLSALQLGGEDSGARTAITDDAGELLLGSRLALELGAATGFHDARNAEGTRFLVLRRSLVSTPWQFVAAKPIAAAPTDTILIVLLASLSIAWIAGVAAFAVGARRLQPLLELAEGARRLAAGEVGVRVDVQTDHGEVATLARSFNEMAGRLESQRTALEERHQELLRANEVLEQLSITDGLTHLHNHRHFHDQFAREVKRADRSQQPLCLMLIDIDDFKSLNDRHGHAAGDRVLAVTAQLINGQVRESDYLARYGGEEFAMLLPQTKLAGAVALAEKIRTVLSQHSFALPDSELRVRVTVSIGVAEHTTTADETFDAADRALYEAKGAGKDCVVAAQPRDHAAPPSERRRR